MRDRIRHRCPDDESASDAAEGCSVGTTPPAGTIGQRTAGRNETDQDFGNESFPLWLGKGVERVAGVGAIKMYAGSQMRGHWSRASQRVMTGLGCWRCPRTCDGSHHQQETRQPTTKPNVRHAVISSGVRSTIASGVLAKLLAGCILAPPTTTRLPRGSPDSGRAHVAFDREAPRGRSNYSHRGTRSWYCIQACPKVRASHGSSWSTMRR